MSRTIQRVVLDDVGDLHAPVGSRPWAAAVRFELQNSLTRVEDEERLLEQWTATFQHVGGWQHLTDATGKAFQSLDDFCRAARPWGLGLSQGEAALQAEIARRRKFDTHGGDRGNQHTGGKRQVANSHLAPTNSLSSTSRERLRARLERDYPKILAKLDRGDFPSVRQAAIAAGIVKVPPLLVSAQKAFDRLDAQDRARFRQWLRDRP